jgi:hypothetical protein
VAGRSVEVVEGVVDVELVGVEVDGEIVVVLGVVVVDVI